jgi:hypothetical protein
VDTLCSRPKSPDAVHELHSRRKRRGNLSSTQHTRPTRSEIVDCMMDVRTKIITNGKGSWLASLSSALQKAGEWDLVATSWDLSLSWEQEPILHACYAEKCSGPWKNCCAAVWDGATSREGVGARTTGGRWCGKTTARQIAKRVHDGAIKPGDGACSTKHGDVLVFYGPLMLFGSGLQECG